MRRVLTQVLNLPRKQQRELADLLDFVSLSGIIAAATLVADRLQFLAGLERLLFDPDEKKTLTERKQLHRMLVTQTWLFGEQFALSVDDQSLTEVLRKHLADFNRDEVDLATPVIRPSGRKGIVDLMLSRRIPRSRDEEREHLIVELKRPKAVVGAKELNQIEEYALAVANDERFRALSAKWEFWLLTTEYDALAKARATQANRPRGLVHENEEPRLRVWVKTWAQLLEENRGRLKFVQDQLGYEPDHESALLQVKRKYEELFVTPGEQSDGEQASEDAEKKPARKKRRSGG